MAFVTPIMKAAAQALLKSASFKYDWSFRTTYSFVHSTLGHGYRRSDMLSDFNRHKGHLSKEYAVTHFDSFAQVEKRLMVETDLRRDRMYRIYGNATYENIHTGEYYTKFGSMYSNTGESYGQWETEYMAEWDNQLATGGASGKASGPEWAPVGFMTRSIEHNKGYPY